MTDKCKFCGADMENAKFDTNSYECGSTYNIELATWEQYWKCLSDQRDNLEAELKQLRDEDATDPIDERLAAAGKIFRELVAEREELRREVERLREVCASALMSLEAQRKYIVDDLQAINHGEDAIGALQSALTEAKQ